MSTSPAGSTRVFISYSHKDTAYLEDLQTYLAYFERNGRLDVWVDTKIKPGQRWFDEIQQGLASACVAIFLVSKDFLASDFIYQEELPALLKAAGDEQVTLLFVLLDVNAFTLTPLSAYQTFKTPGAPLCDMSASDQARVWVRVAEQVIEAVQSRVVNRPSLPPLQARALEAICRSCPTPTSAAPWRVRAAGSSAFWEHVARPVA